MACTWVYRDQKLFPSKLSGPTSAKTGMKELFAQPKLKKDGTQSKVPIFSHCFMANMAWS